MPQSYCTDRCLVNRIVGQTLPQISLVSDILTWIYKCRRTLKHICVWYWTSLVWSQMQTLKSNGLVLVTTEAWALRPHSSQLLLSGARDQSRAFFSADSAFLVAHRDGRRWWTHQIGHLPGTHYELSRQSLSPWQNHFDTQTLTSTQYPSGCSQWQREQCQRGRTDFYPEIDICVPMVLFLVEKRLAWPKTVK